MTNDFHKCLADSHAASDHPLWEQVYRAAFTDFHSMVDERTNGWWQQAGVDRRVVLSGCREIKVDEKVRGRNKRTGKVYEDVALEYVSNNGTQSPGWVCKPLLADYIAYAILPLGRAYLLPVIQMQQAWALHGESWISKYGQREAVNHVYKTLFVPVPPADLFKAIGQELRVQFDPVEYVEGDE